MKFERIGKGTALVAGSALLASSFSGCSWVGDKDPRPATAVEVATQLDARNGAKEMGEACLNLVKKLGLDTREIVASNGKKVEVSELRGYGWEPTVADGLVGPSATPDARIAKSCSNNHVANADIEFLKHYSVKVDGVNKNIINDLNPDLAKLNADLVGGKITTYDQNVNRNAMAAYIVRQLLVLPSTSEDVHVNEDMRGVPGDNLKIPASWYGPIEFHKEGYLAKEMIGGGYTLKTGECVIMNEKGVNGKIEFNPIDSRLGWRACQTEAPNKGEESVNKTIPGKKSTPGRTVEPTPGPTKPTPTPTKTTKPTPTPTRPSPKNSRDSSGAEGGGMTKPGGGGIAPEETKPATKASSTPNKTYVPPAAPSAGKPSQPTVTETVSTPAPESGSTPGDGSANSGDPGGF